MNKLLEAVNTLSEKVLASPAQVSPQVEQVQPVGQVQHVGQVTQQPLHEEYAYDGNISDCFFCTFWLNFFNSLVLLCVCQILCNSYYVVL